MRRILALFFALALLAGLAGCGASNPAAMAGPTASAAPTPTAVPTAKPTPTPAPTPSRDPVLSPGAEESSVLSGPFQQDAEGYVWTGIASGRHLNFINDTLPDEAGYVSSFLYADGGVYTAEKEGFYSMEASVLRFYPVERPEDPETADEDAGEEAEEETEEVTEDAAVSGEGTGEAPAGSSPARVGLWDPWPEEPVVLTEDLSADGRFVLCGPYIFYRSYLEGALQRLDLITGEVITAAPETTGLLAAQGGFVYYGKGGAVYRLDSTLTEEVWLFDGSPNCLVADEAGLCALVYEDEGTTAVLEFRSPDGSLEARAELPELTDNLFYRDGLVYVPQPGMADIEIFDLATWEVREPIVITRRGYGYVVLQFVSDWAVYYETMLDGSLTICRVPLEGGDAETAGYILS